MPERRAQSTRRRARVGADPIASSIAFAQRRLLMCRSAFPFRSDMLVDMDAPQVLRLQAILVGGAAKVHAYQAGYFLDDCRSAAVRRGGGDGEERRSGLAGHALRLDVNQRRTRLAFFVVPNVAHFERTFSFFRRRCTWLLLRHPNVWRESGRPREPGAEGEGPGEESGKGPGQTTVGMQSANCWRAEQFRCGSDRADHHRVDADSFRCFLFLFADPRRSRFPPPQQIRVRPGACWAGLATLAISLHPCPRRASLPELCPCLGPARLARKERKIGQKT